MSITLLDLQRAQSLVSKFSKQTPVAQHTFLDKMWNAQVFLKQEQFQPIGAFKIRGAAHFCTRLSNDQSRNGIVTHSSGNHAQAVAFMGARLGVKTIVIMPENANRHKMKLVKNWGAEIHTCAPTIEAREAAANVFVEDMGMTLIPPFDHDWIIAGQATASMEVHAEVDNLDYLIAPLGGGGLLAGTALATSYIAPKTKVIGAEPETADDGRRGFVSGIRVMQQQTQTVADGLRTTVGAVPFPYIQSLVSDVWTVPDEEIVKWMYRYWEETKTVIEPSSAVPLAALEAHKDELAGKRVGVIITGGNVDFSQLPPQG